MRILFQCSEYPPFRSGGIGTVTKIVAEELVKRGHFVCICGYYCDLSVREQIEEINGVMVYSFNKGTRKGKLRKWLIQVLNIFGLAGSFIKSELSWYEEKIAQIICKNGIDILEMTDFYSFNFFRANLQYRRFNVPTVMRVHGAASFIQRFSGNNKIWVLNNDRRHFSRVDYLCSVSEFAERYVQETFPEITYRGKRVVYNPIENSFLKQNKPSESKSILFIGKLIATKGAYVLAKAFNILSEEFPEWDLRYAGNGNKEDILELLSPEVKKRVVFLGFCNRQKIAEEIDNCSFACIPSFFENFSMVPLEIMGRARAVIFTKRTSGSEIINNGVDGFTVNPDDLTEVCEKLRLLVEDSRLRNEFARRGYMKVKNNFTIDIVISQLLDLYGGLIQKKTES